MAQRSYGQYCAMAKALDVIGDRWTLLIVRELLIGGPSRYTDLRNGLPGIATNLLADRLRELEREGIVRREAAPPPIATTLFELTERGKELEPLAHELGRWGAPLLMAKAAADDEEAFDEEEAFRTHWLSLPLEAHFTDRTPERPPVTIELRTGDEPIAIRTIDGTVRTSIGSSTEHPDAILTGTPQLIFGVLTGRLDLEDASARGLRYEGDPEILRRVQPQALRRV